MEKLPLFVAMLSLQANASEQDVLDAMKRVVDENRNLKDKNTALQGEVDKFKGDVEAQRKAKVKALIDGAITAKKITEAERDSYTSLADANYEAVEKILSAKTPYRSVKDQFEKGDDDEGNDERKGWTFDDWHKKDAKGLAAMKSEKPDQYKALFKKKFGSEPK